MLLSKTIKVEINKTNLSRFKKYKSNLKVGDIFEIAVSELSLNSGYVVEIMCDYCSETYSQQYHKYNRGIKVSNKNSCSKKECISKKRKDSCIEKYGVENPMHLKENKEKLKATNLERHGVECIFQSDDIKDKIKETNIDKYGVDHPMLLDEIKEKVKTTNLERYGVKNPMQLLDIKCKVRKKNKERYGVEYLLQLDEVKNNIKEINLQRHGNQYPIRLEKFKEKTRITNIKKYGVEHPMLLDEIKKKMKATNLERYGVEYPSQLIEIKEIIKKTNLDRYGSNHHTKSEGYRKNIYKIANDNNYIKYIDSHISLFKCFEKDHDFEISSDNYHHRKVLNLPLCTICYPIDDLKSIKEKQLFEFVRSIYDKEIIQSYRDIQEIDIYLPELNLGFEFNGVYWHSSKFRDKRYHLNKTNYFKNKGIKIIHIWEDDWIYKQDIIKSQILHILHKTPNKIYARNCYIKEIHDSSISLNFLNNNHIQGKVNSALKLGLYYQEELISVMTFDHFEGRNKMADSEWNLNRFCNKLNYNVIGGASKLLKYFINNYKPTKIISYADKDWSLGKLYEILKFTKISETMPDYKYIVDNIRIHKSNFKKSITGISESNLNLEKVYDCGKIKYQLLINQ